MVRFGQTIHSFLRADPKQLTARNFILPLFTRHKSTKVDKWRAESLQVRRDLETSRSENEELREKAKRDIESLERTRKEEISALWKMLSRNPGGGEEDDNSDAVRIGQKAERFERRLMEMEAAEMKLKREIEEMRCARDEEEVARHNAESLHRSRIAVSGILGAEARSVAITRTAENTGTKTNDDLPFF